MTATCAFALLSGGCHWYSMTPKERVSRMAATPPRALNTLVLGAPRDGALDCSREECNHWYRLDIPVSGSLTVRVETNVAGERPIMRLLIQQIGHSPIAQTMGGTSDVLTVRGEVQAGLYMVLVQGGGGRLPYTVTATLEAAGS